jgi:hypothetical protein
MTEKCFEIITEPCGCCEVFCQEELPCIEHGGTGVQQVIPGEVQAKGRPKDKAAIAVVGSTPTPSTKPGDHVKCPHCGAVLVLVSRLGLWACDLGTKRRHRCLREVARG